MTRPLAATPRLDRRAAMLGQPARQRASPRDPGPGRRSGQRGIDRGQQVPLVLDRVPWRARHAADGPRGCTSSLVRAHRSRRGPARRVGQVSHALRGPPCKSIAMSKRRARRRRPSRRSSRTRRHPRRRSDDDELGQCGISGDDGRRGRFNEIDQLGDGNWRRSARTIGVVNTTSPIRRRRTSRILNADHFSIVASSISMTGMSSLTGYTR